jgi:hypothetical protein
MALYLPFLLADHISCLLSRPPAGSHLPLVSPALEFVKAATHVMGLDPHLAQEVAALRRLLLTQVTRAAAYE